MSIISRIIIFVINKLAPRRVLILNHTLALEKHGFSVFETNSQKSMIEIASNLGDIFKVETMPLIQTLTPRLKVNESDNTYSGNLD